MSSDSARAEYSPTWRHAWRIWRAFVWRYALAQVTIMPVAALLLIKWLELVMLEVTEQMRILVLSCYVVALGVIGVITLVLPIRGILNATYGEFRLAIVPSTSQRAQTSLVPWQRRDPMPTTASLSILLGGALLIVAIGVFWIGIEPQPGDDGFISFSACFAAGVAALLYGISKATVHARRSKNYV